MESILAAVLFRKGAARPPSTMMIREAIRSSVARRRIIVAALALSICSCARPAGAASSEPPPDAGLTVLHLSESADREIRRDRLRAQLRIEATAGNAKQVQADINRRMTSALDKVKAVPGIKPETGGYAVYEERQRDGAGCAGRVDQRGIEAAE